MKSSLTKGLSETDAKAVSEEFAHSPALRHRIVEMLTEKVSAAEVVSVSKSSYDSPNWALLQADLVGYKRAMKEINSILCTKVVKSAS